LLQPYLAVKAQELICLGLSKLLPRDRVPILGLLGDSRDGRLARVGSLLQDGEASPLTIPGIAAAVGLSIEELSTRFRSAYGITLPEFIATTRMARARVLLEQTNCRLKEIAFRSGYRHLSNFCTAYKRHYGVTPGEARQNARGVDNETDRS
jgi:transcriptional regulator GlxA family with amidase domain